jgi:hypothetical protein
VIDFAGQRCTVKDVANWLPGPNRWVGNEWFVWADALGLHLNIRPTNGCAGWASSECTFERSLGYGTYLFRMAGPLETLDPEATFGLFLWDDNCPGDCFFREIDIEVGRWGRPSDANAMQYVVQPWTRPGNIYRSSLRAAAPVSGSGAGSGGCNDGPEASHFNNAAVTLVTCALQWYPRLIRWACFNGLQTLQDIRRNTAGAPLAPGWEYWDPAKVPTPGTEKVHLNLWQANAGRPAFGRRVHVVTQGFEHTPQWIDLGANNRVPFTSARQLLGTGAHSYLGGLLARSLQLESLTQLEAELAAAQVRQQQQMQAPTAFDSSAAAPGKPMSLWRSLVGDQNVRRLVGSAPGGDTHGAAQRRLLFAEFAMSPTQAAIVRSMLSLAAALNESTAAAAEVDDVFFNEAMATAALDVGGSVPPSPAAAAPSTGTGTGTAASLSFSLHDLRSDALWAWVLQLPIGIPTLPANEAGGGDDTSADTDEDIGDENTGDTDMDMGTTPADTTPAGAAASVPYTHITLGEWLAAKRQAEADAETEQQRQSDRNATAEDAAAAAGGDADTGDRARRMQQKQRQQQQPPILAAREGAGWIDLITHRVRSLFGGAVPTQKQQGKTARRAADSGAAPGGAGYEADSDGSGLRTLAGLQYRTGENNDFARSFADSALFLFAGRTAREVLEASAALGETNAWAQAREQARVEGYAKERMAQWERLVHDKSRAKDTVARSVGATLNQWSDMFQTPASLKQQANQHGSGEGPSSSTAYSRSRFVMSGVLLLTALSVGLGVLLVVHSLLDRLRKSGGGRPASLRDLFALVWGKIGLRGWGTDQRFHPRTHHAQREQQQHNGNVSAALEAGKSPKPAAGAESSSLPPVARSGVTPIAASGSKDWRPPQSPSPAAMGESASGRQGVPAPSPSPTHVYTAGIRRSPTVAPAVSSSGGAVPHASLSAPFPTAFEFPANIPSPLAIQSPRAPHSASSSGGGGPNVASPLNPDQSQRK